METRLKLAATLAMLALVGCDSGTPDTAAKTEVPAPVATAAATVVPASDLLIRARSDELDFGWRMVPDVAAFPPLLAELRRDAQGQLAEATKGAADDRGARPADAPFFGHYFQQNWRVEADTTRLLSLMAETDTFTGGAHGMHMSRGLIWDKQARRKLALPELFVDWAKAHSIVEAAYCRELDRERADRRGSPAKIGGSFDDCPPLLEQTVTLAGWNDNASGGLKVYLDPYTAGPYSEGTYELWVFPEPALSKLVKPEYRPRE